jgi:cytochrome c peroxidase
MCVLVVGAGCANDPSGQVDVFSPPEWMKIQQLSPLGAVPKDATNKWADDAKAATFGQRLFYDKAISGAVVIGLDKDPNAVGNTGDTGKVSCVTCHDPTSWFDDPRGTHVSLGLKYTPRNDPSLVNVAFYEYFGWGGKSDTLWMQAAGALEGSDGCSRLQAIHIVYAKYKDDYNAIFTPAIDPDLDPNSANASRFPATGKPTTNPMMPGNWEMMAPADQVIANTIFINSAKAIAAYERLLVSRNAPFDQYVAGNYSAISASAKRGLGLFIGKANCAYCHSGSFFTDEEFHVTGVPQTGANVPMMDSGHYGDLGTLTTSPFNSAGAFSDDAAAGMKKLMDVGMPTDKDKGAFRTKNLRQIAKTGPYMHTGGLATLTDVVNFYNMGGATTGFEGTKDPSMLPLNLTTSEVADLVEFLNTLTGDPVPTALTMDTSAK